MNGSCRTVVDDQRPTLGELQRATPWVWLWCERCQLTRRWRAQSPSSCGGRMLQATNCVPAHAALIAAEKARPSTGQAGPAIISASIRFRLAPPTKADEGFSPQANHMNAINVISPYKHHGMWVFDGLAVRRTAGPSGHANSPHPSSREGHHSTAEWSSTFLLSRLIRHGCHAAAVSSRVQRNSVPSTQMRCMITANRRARATIAFFIPRRLAICIAQALSHDHFFERSML
jgi:hypothetical protein